MATPKEMRAAFNMAHTAAERSRILTRREFLAAAATAAAAAIAACAPASPPLTPGLSREQINLLTGRDRLLAEIDDLPETNIKRLLQERIKPYYNQQPGTQIVRNGFNVRLERTTVLENTIGAQDLSNGVFRYRSDPPPEISYHPTEKRSIKVPLNFLLSEAEIRQRGESVNAPFEINTTNTIWAATSPEIIINSPDTQNANPERKRVVQSYERFGYIKEALGLLLADITIDTLGQEMAGIGTPTVFDVIDNQGNPTKINIVSDVYSGLFDRDGRTQALLDIGGYVLAANALRGTSELQTIGARNPLFGELIANSRNLRLGSTPKDMLRGTNNWVFENPNLANKLPHAGNMNQIPMNIDLQRSKQYAYSAQPQVYPFIA